MEQRIVTVECLREFAAWLRREERSDGTIEKYIRDVTGFADWMQGREVTKELATAWKGDLQSRGYAPVTINSMLSAVNAFFRFAGWEDCRLRFLRIQRKMFCEQARELKRDEYDRLIETARMRGQERLALLMETIGATGIRVSEVQYMTVEAARKGKAEISLKGKIRTILLPGKLCRKLLKYAKKRKIASGEIFLTRSGKGLSRRQIWAEMKALCRHAGVEAGKVFPHNLRKLFASTFYRVYKDIVRLADILGHSSVETTRIYLLTAGEEHRRQIERLQLVS